MTVERQFCTFHLGALFLGIEVRQVQEVLGPQPMTRVPLAPRAVEGLINLRGQIVTAIDLRERLGMPPRADDREPMNVVVRTGEGVVSLLVDEIGDVLETEEAQYESLPQTLSHESRALLRGVYKLPERLLLILDAELAVAAEAAGR